MVNLNFPLLMDLIIIGLLIANITKKVSFHLNSKLLNEINFAPDKTRLTVKSSKTPNALKPYCNEIIIHYHHPILETKSKLNIVENLTTQIAGVAAN